MKHLVLVLLLAQGYGAYGGYGHPDPYTPNNRPRQATTGYQPRPGTVTNPYHFQHRDGSQTEVWALDPGPDGPAPGSAINPYQIEE